MPWWCSRDSLHTSLHVSRYPEDHFASTKIIGQRQSDKAIDLFQTATKKVDGKIDYRQAYVDMSSLGVVLTSGEVVSTCPAAVGFSFAAGTTDGPGAFDFTQGDNKVWRNLVSVCMCYWGPARIVLVLCLPLTRSGCPVSPEVSFAFSCQWDSFAGEFVLENSGWCFEGTKSRASELPTAKACFDRHRGDVYSLCLGGKHCDPFMGMLECGRFAK